MKTIKIGHRHRYVGDGHPCFVVAEIGINHNGSVENALQLINIAKEAGCQAVKFQKRTVSVVYSEAELAKPRSVPDEIITNAINRNALPPLSVERLKKNIKDTTNGDLKYALEFGSEEYKVIDQYCKNIGILWFSSPWDEESVDFLEQFDPPCYKVASASMTDKDLLSHVASKSRPVILGTGMSTWEQMVKAVTLLNDSRTELIISHTVSTYPAERRDLNLAAMLEMKKYFDRPIAYSGHERGTTMSVCAVALGANMVERHITIHRDMWGSDQSASLEPTGLKTMVSNIRDFERALGDGVKVVLPAEIPIMQKLRRKDTL